MFDKGTRGMTPVRLPPKPTKSDKPFLRWFLESAGGAAIVTALIGGCFAQWITYIIQRDAANREFNSVWVKARGDQALSTYKDYINEQTHMLDQLYAAVGSMISASEVLVGSEYWKFKDTKTQSDSRNVALTFNAAEADWVRSQRRYGFLLSYYSNSNSNILGQWKVLSATVDTYRECVSTWRDSFDGNRRAPPEAICSVQKSAIDKSLAELGALLEKNRTYLWKNWERPDDLRKTLGIR